MTTTDLTWGLCEGDTLLVTIEEPDPLNPGQYRLRDISSDLVKLWVNRIPGKRFSGADVVKKSYFATEIEKTDPVNGEATVLIRNEDNDRLGKMLFCVEATERGVAVAQPPAAKVSVTAGSGVLVGTAIDTSVIFDEYLLQAVSGDSANNKLVSVSVEKDGDGVPTGNLLSDYADWTTAVDLAFTLYVGVVKKPESLHGDWIVSPC